MAKSSKNNLPQKIIDFIDLSVELLDNDICTLNELNRIITFEDKILRAEINRRIRNEKKDLK